MQAGKFKKILIINEGQLGDLLVLTPALKAIKEHLPQSHVTVALTKRSYYVPPESKDRFVKISKGEGTAEALKNNPYVDEMIAINRKHIREQRGLKRIKAEFYIVKFLRQKKYDCVINAFPEDRFMIWSFLAGIKTRVGQKNHKLSYLLTHKINKSPNEINHLNYILLLLNAIGISSTDKKTFFFIPEESNQWIECKLNELNIYSEKKIISIHPGASKPDRVWSVKYFAELTKLLMTLNNIEPVICSSDFDEEIVNDILQKLDVKPKVMKITDNISNLAALFKHSELVVCNDSGPRHLAAAVGVRSISVFKRHNDKQWKIYPEELAKTLEKDSSCSKCPEDKCLIPIPDGEKYGAECMWSIKPETVFNEIKSMINIT